MQPTSDVVRVLHVDRDRESLDRIARRLPEVDDRIEILGVRTAARALAEVRDGSGDCLVCEHDLETTSGLELVERLRATAPGLPVVLFTDAGSEAVAAEAVSLGVDGYLSKAEHDAEDLASTVLETTAGDPDVPSVGAGAAVADGRGSDGSFDSDLDGYVRELAEHANDVLWVFTASWDEVLFVNRAYEEIYGRPVEELRERPQGFLDAVHPDDRADVREMMRDLAAGNETEGEYRVNEQDDFERWVWVQAQPIVRGGEVVRIVGFSRDVTDRKHHEEELDLLRRAMDEAPIGVTITEPDREDNPIVYLNDGFQRLTGYDEAEALGRNCRFLQGENTEPEPVAELRRAIDAAETTAVELRNYRADGTEFWNEVTVAPVFGGADDLTHFVGFQQDVTDRKRREDLIEVLNRVLRHNLRNDMNVVHGFAELLLDELPAEGRAREYVETILSRTRGLVALTESASQLEATLREIESQSSRPVGDVVEGAVCRTTERHPGAAIEVEWSYDPDRTVAETVEEALVELLDNAVRHSGTRSATVAVEATDDESDAVRLVVRDLGPGIPEQERNVLETGRETQLDHGSGLGLWLVYWIVTGCGGRVSVPETDRGTTVEVEVPVE